MCLAVVSIIALRSDFCEMTENVSILNEESARYEQCRQSEKDGT